MGPLVWVLSARETFTIPYLPEGAVGLSIIGIFALFWRFQRSFVALAAQDIKTLRAENRLCNWRLDILLGLARRAGADIPEEVWNPPHLLDDEEND